MKLTHTPHCGASIQDTVVPFAVDPPDTSRTSDRSIISRKPRLSADSRLVTLRGNAGHLFFPLDTAPSVHDMPSDLDVYVHDHLVELVMVGGAAPTMHSMGFSLITMYATLIRHPLQVAD